MKNKNTSRSRIIGLRLTDEEFQKLEARYAQTTARRISEYVRCVLFNKPVTVLQRNQSLDDFMTEMIHLRNELNSIGNNFNQAVKKLHTLHQIAEFKSWFLTYQADEKLLLQKVEEIKNKINKIADEWLQ